MRSVIHRPLTLVFSVASLTACGGGVPNEAAVGSGPVASTARAVSTTEMTETTVPAPSRRASDEENPAVAQAAEPELVRIPTIAVSASIIPLGLRDDGSIEVPDDPDQTGWWVDGPEPGERGPSVVLGHVDSSDGPAVFARLGELGHGALIHIDRIDGTTVTYEVDRIEQHPKDDFPTEAVYGDTDEAVLRLVTCGGVFDQSSRHYVDNVIVFASAVGASDG